MYYSSVFEASLNQTSSLKLLKLALPNWLPYFFEGPLTQTIYSSCGIWLHVPIVNGHQLFYNFLSWLDPGTFNFDITLNFNLTPLPCRPHADKKHLCDVLEIVLSPVLQKDIPSLDATDGECSVSLALTENADKQVFLLSETEMIALFKQLPFNSYISNNVCFTTGDTVRFKTIFWLSHIVSYLFNSFVFKDGYCFSVWWV